MEDRQLVEPAYSEKIRVEDWWEPDHITYRFSSKMRCANPTCGEIVFVTGSGTVDDNYDEDGQQYQDVLSLSHSQEVP